MGAGCYFTNDLTGDKAAWINFPQPDNEDSQEESSFLIQESTVEDITSLLSEIGYNKSSERSNVYFNGLFKLTLTSTDYGDGLIFYFNSRFPEYNYYTGKLDPCYILAKANLHRTEKKVLSHLMKNGYEFYIATSGYTSEKLVY